MYIFVILPVSALWRNMERGSKTCFLVTYSLTVWRNDDFQDYFSLGCLSDVLVLGSFYIAG